jgi:vancomycin resistance protein VanW
MDLSIQTRAIAPRRSLAGLAMAAALALLLSLVGLLFSSLSEPPRREVELAGYSTSLEGRTDSQRINARKAADALNGKLIGPGAVFSFNRVVKSWSFDQGFLKAPVSYDGELVRAYGGGVCQTSTTLYNAVLLAGLPIVERHSHVFAPHYVPPGRDAAVAQLTIDLRFRNPYRWPIRIRSTTTRDRLDIRLYGAELPRDTVDVESEVLNAIEPRRLTRVVYRPGGTAGRSYLRNPGAVGCRVVTYRVTFRGSTEVRRERLADDTYEAMDRIVQVTETGPPSSGR